jgi:hypothetical protein
MSLSELLQVLRAEARVVVVVSIALAPRVVREL